MSIIDRTSARAVIAARLAAEARSAGHADHAAATDADYAAWKIEHNPDTCADWAARVKTGRRRVVFVGLMENTRQPGRITRVGKAEVWVKMDGETDAHPFHPGDLRVN